MRVGHRSHLLVAFGLLLAAHAAAQENDLAPKTLETMRRHVESLRAISRSPEGKEAPLPLVATPVLRYSDPGGITTDASIWVWGDQGRPAIVAGVFFLTQEGKGPKWSCELLSLSAGGVAVDSGAGWNWTPSNGNLEWLSLEDAPADTARQRLRQMKAIAEGYELTGFEGTLSTQLRLMVQPLVRYADEEQGLIDGAIFSFASGTNPEALLIVECRRDARALAWRAALARFGANRCQARTGETVVWECPAIGKWDPREPYFSRFGPAEEVFAAADAK
jgi:hypothetical protein